MKKKKQVAAPSLEQANGRVRAAKDEFKRLRSLTKDAKRDLKAARKALKKARKVAAANPKTKTKTKVNKSAAKKKAQAPARATAAPAKPATRKAHGQPHARTTRRPRPAELDDASLLANSEAELGEESESPTV